MAFAHLPDRGVVAVTGADAVAFLQGLLSNDVAAIPGGEARWAALLTPQGKWLADVFVIPAPDGDGVLLDCERAQAPMLARVLSRYRLRAKVTVADASDAWAVHAGWAEPGQGGPRLGAGAGQDGSPSVGGAGEGGPRLGAGAWQDSSPSVSSAGQGNSPPVPGAGQGGSLPGGGAGPDGSPPVGGVVAGPDAARRTPTAESGPAAEEGIAVRDPRHPDAGWRLLLRAPRDGGDTPEAYDLHRLALGLPDGSRDLDAEKTVLLEAGFDELHGVSWTKGCYMGQELTARTKYRGLLKKRLFPVAVAGPLPPRGAAVTLDGAEVGEMRSGRDGLGLALLRLDAARAPALACAEAVLTPRIPDWMRLPDG